MITSKKIKIASNTFLNKNIITSSTCLKKKNVTRNFEKKILPVIKVVSSLNHFPFFLVKSGFPMHKKISPEIQLVVGVDIINTMVGGEYYHQYNLGKEILPAVNIVSALNNP